MAWKGESRRHSLARKGIKTAKGKVVDNRKFIGKERHIIQDYKSYKTFLWAVKRIVNSTFNNEYFWDDDEWLLKNEKTFEEKFMTLAEAFQSDEIWTERVWNLKIGQNHARMEAYHGDVGGIQNFDIRWEYNPDYIQWLENRRRYKPSSEGEGHIYVTAGRWIMK